MSPDAHIWRKMLGNHPPSSPPRARIGGRDLRPPRLDVYRLEYLTCNSRNLLYQWTEFPQLKLFLSCKVSYLCEIFGRGRFPIIKRRVWVLYHRSNAASNGARSGASRCLGSKSSNCQARLNLLFLSCCGSNNSLFSSSSRSKLLLVAKKSISKLICLEKVEKILSKERSIASRVFNEGISRHYLYLWRA